MAAIVSVVSGGAVVQTQRFDGLNIGQSMRLGAISGARYMLSESGASASSVFAKRVGKNLLLEQRSESSESSTLVIDGFFASDAQLLGLSAEGEYVPYLAVAEADAEQLAGDDGYAQLTLGTVQPAAFVDGLQFVDGGARVSNAALAGLATLAGGSALSNDRGGGNSAPAAAVAPVSSLPKVDAAGSAAYAPAVTSADASANTAPLELGNSLVPEAVVQGDAVSVESADLPPTVEDSKQAPLTADPADESATTIATATTTAGQAPAPADTIPVIDEVRDDQGAIQGNVENGGYTDDGRPQLVGKADAGVLVHIYRNSELIGQVVADANGQWSFMPKLPFADGRHAISILHEYPDGDFSDFSDPYVIFVDKSVPDAPLITGMVDDQGRITGTINNLMVTDDNRPTIDGTAEAHATIIVYDKGNEIGRTKVDADGNWRFTPEPALADGTHILSYSAVDRAGNGSERSASSEFVVDTRPEKINIYYADDDAGAITGEVFSGGVTDDTTPTLFGTATAGGMVSIYEGDVLLGQVIADVDGTWQFTPPTALGEGQHTFHATVTLVAKGESERSKPFKLEVDFTAPAEPTIDQVTDDVGAIQGIVESGQTTDDATPTLSGKAEKGSTVRIFANGSLLGSVLADANGLWVFTPASPLAEGLQKFTITAADAAGNQSAPSAPYEIHIDTLRPEAPTIVSIADDVGQVQGLLQKGDTTDDTQPTINGTAEANSTVVIRDNGVEIGRVQVNANGEWSFTPDLALSAGAHALTVVALDAAGNLSAPSDVFDLNIAVVPPVRAAAPTIVSIYDDVGLVKGLLGTGATTDDSMPLINGKGEPNTTIILKDNGVEIGRALVNEAGDWSFLPASALNFGLHNLVATAMDKAGNLSSPSSLFGFRVAAPGTGGAMENFNSVDYYDSTGETLHVLPSGLTVKGQFFGEQPVWMYTNPGGMRPEDRSYGMFMTGAKVPLVFTLPIESSSVSFYHFDHMSAAIATFLDVNGKVIGEEYLLPNSSYEKTVFNSPPGIFVASIEIALEQSSGAVAIESMQWGERTPSGVSIASAETDGFGGRIVYGKVPGIESLDPSLALQVTTDGGVTWTNATVREGSWVAMQKDMPPGDWVAEVRIIELASGLSLGFHDTKAVQVIGAKAPTIERIADAEGMYTSAKAADGSVIVLSIEG